jgi:two-component system nitrate/nitrite response regulator NarL
MIESPGSVPVYVEPVEVGIVADSEVLRKGLEALLNQIPRASVASWDSLPNPLSEWGSTGRRVVITTVGRWHQLKDETDWQAPDRPLVLVVGDDVNTKDISGSPELPCDGVMSLEKATTSALDTVLHRVTAREMPIPPALARQLLAENRGQGYRSVGGLVPLTAREKETLDLLAQGLSNKQIAKSLAISAHGAKRLVGVVLMKLGAPNRTTAVITAINEGLV